MQALWWRRYQIPVRGVVSTEKVKYDGACMDRLTSPRRISPTSRTGLLGAKKTMKMKQVKRHRATRRTRRGPKAVMSQPFKIVPTIEPTPERPLAFAMMRQETGLTRCLPKTSLPSSSQTESSWSLIRLRYRFAVFYLEGRVSVYRSAKLEVLDMKLTRRNCQEGSYHSPPL